MRTLEVAGLVIILLITLGRFLDSEHVEVSTKDRIRVKLIGLYVWLYDIPAHFKFTALKARLDRLFEAREIDVTTGRTIINRKSVWRARWYYFIGIPAFSLGFAYLAQYVLHPDADGIWRHTREEAWWIGLFGGLTLAILGPLILSILMGLLFIVSMLVGLVALAILEAVRRSALTVLSKSTSPRTSPFSYFAALLSVVTIVISLLTYFL